MGALDHAERLVMARAACSDEVGVMLPVERDAVAGLDVDELIAVVDACSRLAVGLAVGAARSPDPEHVRAVIASVAAHIRAS